MMETPWLVLDPDYQRNVVWSIDRMSRLIGSLMSNYYVPPLIFNVKKIATGVGSLRYQSTLETGYDKAMRKKRGTSYPICFCDGAGLLRVY